MYDFNKEDGTQGADDFTQMLWKGTKRFGIGFAKMESGEGTCTYVVARYRPTGNVAGAFRDNVASSVDKRTCTNPSTLGSYSVNEEESKDFGKIEESQPEGERGSSSSLKLFPRK